MQRIFSRPKATYVGLVVAIVAFFSLSAVGNQGDKNTSWTWLGDIGWTLFLLSILATLIYTVALLVRFSRGRTRRQTG
jgi:hypothetical protein